jgi:hypothetical protein
MTISNKSNLSNPLISSLIDQLQEIQSGNVWLGVNFEKKLKLLDEEGFFHKPNELYSVAEILSHLTAWRKDVIIKITTGKGNITDCDQSNWVNNEALKKLGWKSIMAEYQSTLSNIIDLLNDRTDAFLNDHYFDIDFNGNYPYSFALYGLLHHDIYHLGQIGMLITMVKKKQKPDS